MTSFLMPFASRSLSHRAAGEDPGRPRWAWSGHWMVFGGSGDHNSRRVLDLSLQPLAGGL